MYAFAGTDELHFGFCGNCCRPHGVVEWVSDVANEDGGLGLLVEAEEVAHLEVSGCEEAHGVEVAHSASASSLMPLAVEALSEIDEVEVVPVVTHALHDGLGLVPGEEGKRVHGFHVLGVLLLEDGLGGLLARGCVVGKELHVVLRAVELENVERLSVGRP